MWATRTLSLAKKNNTKYTSEQTVWSYVFALRALPLAKNNTKYTSGQHIGSYLWAPRALCTVFLQGKVLAGPTNMTKYVAARGARGAAGAPGVPDTLGPQRRAHGGGFGSQ